VFPDDVVVPIPSPNVADAAAVAHLVDNLDNADAWVTASSRAHAETYAAGRHALRVVRIPIIRFSAFHPDLCYATNAATKAYTSPHYNSKIAVWCDRNELEISNAARLFNKGSYRALGYFAQWHVSEYITGQLFQDAGLSTAEFARFFAAIKRRGAFMHSVNHPSIQTIVELARIVAIRLGADARTVDREIVLADGLAESLWPVYPEIADELALSGSYVWKFEDERVPIVGLEKYLEFAYKGYATQRIRPSDLTPINVDRAAVDRVLRAQVGALT
jgi:hypothetical protein